MLWYRQSAHWFAEPFISIEDKASSSSRSGQLDEIELNKQLISMQTSIIFDLFSMLNRKKFYIGRSNLFINEIGNFFDLD